MTDLVDELEESEILEPGSELVPLETPAPATLYGSRDPKLVRDKMVELADVLMDVVRTKRLAVSIRDREHLTVEAWTTLGAFVGVHAAIVWTRLNESGDGIIARAEARTLEGALVGAAESECSRVESRWKSAEPYAIRSMAQTRALSRALQAPLRHIAVLAGYEGTAAEEAPPEEPVVHGDVVHDDGVHHAEPASRAQVEEIAALLRSLEEIDPERDWRGEARGIAGGSAGKLSNGQAETVLERLRERLKAATA
jgi:hypothetical protein